MISSVDVNDQRMPAPLTGGLQAEEEVGLPLEGDPVLHWDAAGLLEEEAGLLEEEIGVEGAGHAWEEDLDHGVVIGEGAEAK